ncbi:MAG: putative phage abortive infection protein [Pseudomonadales bacterium]|nr:putative phage abortive infection protein [Pseudomonadales bacterium]
MTKEDKVSNDTGLKNFNTIVFIVSVVIVTSVSLYAYKFGVGFWDTPERWGALGDFFGGVLNPLLAFSSLVLLLATLKQNQKALSQNEEALRLNNSELEMTRNELSQSKEALIKQATTLDKQSFEGTFFNLLSLHQDLVNSIDFANKKGDVTKGKDCFKTFYNRFEQNTQQVTYQGFLDPKHFSKFLDAKYIMQKSNTPSINVKFLLEEEYITSCYMAFYAYEQSEIGHYFRNLYNIIKFVDQSDVDDKKLYINLLRAQLSTYELTLLFYNCLSPVGSKKFKPYIENYSLLKGVSGNILIDESHKYFYSTKAFDSNA